MNIKELKTILVTAAHPAASVNFSDVGSAAKNALNDHFELTGLSIRDIRGRQSEVFKIIEEVVEEIMPITLEERIGQFAEIKTYGRDEIAKFTIKNLSKRRIARAIVPGARGGLYRAKRLDNRDMILSTVVSTVGYQITLEEILLGTHTIADLVNVITNGFVENIYFEVIRALRGAYGSVPAANKASASGVNDAQLQGLVRTVSAYGKPVIIGFQSEAEKLTNQVILTTAANPNLPTADLDEIRNRGFISMYHSTPVIVLPNYFMDETNSQWMFNEGDLFILPVDEKPVKVALQGELYTREVAQPAGGMEYHAHRMLGVGILFFNAMAIYRDTAGQAGVY